jgi:transketolase
VELGVSQGWQRYIGERGDMLAVDCFGASAPAETLLREFGFTVDNVVARARKLMADHPDIVRVEHGGAGAR